MNKMFIQKDTCGYQNGHEYEIEIYDQDLGGYIIEATFDNTDETEVSLMIYLSNMNSVKEYFV